MNLRLGIWMLMGLQVFGASQGDPADIPPQYRINAQVIHYLTGPADQPLIMPTDLALDSKDRVYVADGVNNRVVRFTSEGQFDKIMVPANGEKLLRPVGLTLDSDDQLWIADTGNHRVLTISADEKRTEIIDLPPSEEGLACDVTDLAVTTDGKRSYMVDNNNHRLLIRENDSGELKFMGRKGRALGQFDYPFMICLGTEQYVYITEAMGARLHCISPTDRWSRLISGWGIELGQLYRPKGLTADKQGKIYVSDSTLRVIQVFGPWGRIKGVLCDQQGQPLRFEHPMGMDFDSQGRLYVVELGGNRVAVLSLTGDEKEDGSEN